MEVHLTPDQKAFVRQAIESGRLNRGEGRAITQESMRQLADEVKQRGSNRLAAEQSSRR
jgi:hypothetical protein